MLAAAVDGHLLDEHVLDALQEGGRAHRVCAAHTQPPSSPVPGGVYLTCTKALHFFFISWSPPNFCLKLDIRHHFTLVILSGQALT